MAARKGKKEKQAKTPEVTQVEERSTEKEIAPGKGFYESDWHKLLEREDNTSFIRSLVDEVFGLSYARILHKTAEDKSYEYSVQWAKKMMLETIECFFLSHDSGENTQSNYIDSLWEEDKEPCPPIVDSWARGMVPLEEKDKNEEKEEEAINIKHEESMEEVSSLKDLDIEQIQKHNETEESDIMDSKPEYSLKFRQNRPSHQTKGRRNRTEGMMKVLTHPPINENEWESHTEINTVQSQTPPSSTAMISVPPTISGHTHNGNLIVPHKRSEVMTDRDGRVMATVRLDTRKFPSPSIKPKVTLSPTSSTQQPNKKKLHSHKQSLYDRPTQRRRVTPMVRNTLSTGTTEQRISVDKGAIGGMVRIESQRFPKRPSLPPLVDLIDPLPGVIIHEHGRSIKGYVSPRSKLHSPATRLQPITPNVKKIPVQQNGGSTLNISEHEEIQLTPMTSVVDRNSSNKINDMYATLVNTS